jgi:hypothetical protein
VKLEAARSIIASAPNTHLAEAARIVLALLDAADTGRLEAAEAQQSVHINALEVAKQEAASLRLQVRAILARKDYWEGRFLTERDRLADQIAERDRLAKELEEARKPDPDLSRLRALEKAAREVVGAMQPTGFQGRGVYDRIVAHLRPHL